MRSLSAQLYAADTIQFNTALFDLEDKKNIDVKQSRAGYIMPGIYPLKVQVNKETLPEQRFHSMRQKTTLKIASFVSHQNKSSS